MNDGTNSHSNGRSPGSRRSFFKLAVGALASLIGIVIGIPVLRSAMHSSTLQGSGWSEVTDLEKLPLNRPEKIRFPTFFQDAYIHGMKVRSVWVIKNPAGDVTVFSPVCTHLGCYYSWNNAAGRFECPCHGSVFSFSGKVLGGPAPRPLDTLPHKIENGVLFVRWEEFKSGLAQKVRA
jgi:menaquinol-cytochrome c reductase iron-sulfur subunit